MLAVEDEGLTQNSTVLAEMVLDTVTLSSVPSKFTPAPYLPLVQVGSLVRVPVLALPEES